MKRLFCSFLWFCALFAEAQDQLWQSGALVLQNREVRAGEIQLDSRHRFVLFRDTGQFRMFQLPQLQTIRFYDSESGVNRHYDTFFDSEKNTWRLMEYVISGRVSMVRVLRPGPRAEETDPSCFRYFVVYRGETVPVEKWKSKVLKTLKQEFPELDQLMVTHHWRASSLAGVIQIVKAANQQSTTSMLAFRP